MDQKFACVLWLAEHKSVITIQRLFRREYNKDPPHENNIRRRHKAFKETGSVQKGKSTGTPRASQKNFERIRQSSVQNTQKSSSECGLKLNFDWTSVVLLMVPLLKLTNVYRKLSELVARLELPHGEKLSLTSSFTETLDKSSSLTGASAGCFSCKSPFSLESSVSFCWLVNSMQNHTTQFHMNEKSTDILYIYTYTPLRSTCMKSESAHSLEGVSTTSPVSIGSDLLLSTIVVNGSNVERVIWSIPSLITEESVHSDSDESARASEFIFISLTSSGLSISGRIALGSSKNGSSMACSSLG
ncbi:hypothetical protein C0J52_07510 [Blattella germanica]|nr:hypothetical protein C0J52_07510 [Blattella germanica]